MNSSKQNIDTDRLYARYAKLRNASVVANEFGVSRYQVTNWWNKLPEAERAKYEAEVEQARAVAVAAAAQEQRAEIIDATEQIVRLRDSLLKKLTLSVAALDQNDPATINRIKDATTALKNIADIETIPSNNSAETFFTDLINRQKIYERKS